MAVVELVGDFSIFEEPLEDLMLVLEVAVAFVLHLPWIYFYDPLANLYWYDDLVSFWTTMESIRWH